jgi:hypothetical protein
MASIIEWNVLVLSAESVADDLIERLPGPNESIWKDEGSLGDRLFTTPNPETIKSIAVAVLTIVGLATYIGKVVLGDGAFTFNSKRKPNIQDIKITFEERVKSTQHDLRSTEEVLRLVIELKEGELPALVERLNIRDKREFWVKCCDIIGEIVRQSKDLMK